MKPPLGYWKHGVCPRESAYHQSAPHSWKTAASDVVKREYHVVKREYHVVKREYHVVKREYHVVKREYHVVKHLAISME
jgi:hypothetical protein